MAIDPSSNLVPSGLTESKLAGTITHLPRQLQGLTTSRWYKWWELMLRNRSGERCETWERQISTMEKSSTRKTRKHFKPPTIKVSGWKNMTFWSKQHLAGFVTGFVKAFSSLQLCSDVWFWLPLTKDIIQLTSRLRLLGFRWWIWKIFAESFRCVSQDCPKISTFYPE